jgi:hypothetical protein
MKGITNNDRPNMEVTGQEPQQEAKAASSNRHRRPSVQVGDNPASSRREHTPRPPIESLDGDAVLVALRQAHGGGLPRPLTNPNATVQQPSIFTPEFGVILVSGIALTACSYIVDHKVGVGVAIGLCAGLMGLIGRR